MSYAVTAPCQRKPTKIAVLGTCQALGISSCMQVLTPDIEVVGFISGRMTTPH